MFADDYNLFYSDKDINALFFEVLQIMNFIKLISMVYF